MNYKEITHLLKNPKNNQPVTDSDFIDLGDSELKALLKSDSSLLYWQSSALKLLNDLKVEAENLNFKIENHTSILTSTEERLKMRINGLKTNYSTFTKLLSPLLNLTPSELSIEEALVEKQPLTQHISSYYDTLLRDWAWNTNENSQTTEFLASNIKQKNLGKVAILGCGSSKNVLDFLSQYEYEMAVGIDINPLLLLSTMQILKGSTLKICEFPLSPIHNKNTTIEWQLKSSQQYKNIYLLLADAINPPFKDKVFDTVITPWFLDIIPENPLNMTKRINRILKENGLWVNFGPLGYSISSLIDQWGEDEFQEYFQQTDEFTLNHSKTQTVDYLCSPHSGQERREKLFFFSASKNNHAKTLKDFQFLPEWITNPEKPIPQEDFFTQTQFNSKVHFEILSTIDGNNSINSIAKMMELHYSMEHQMALSSLITFFSNIYEREFR